VALAATARNGYAPRCAALPRRTLRLPHRAHYRVQRALPDGTSTPLPSYLPDLNLFVPLTLPTLRTTRRRRLYQLDWRRLRRSFGPRHACGGGSALPSAQLAGLRISPCGSAGILGTPSWRDILLGVHAGVPLHARKHLHASFPNLRAAAAAPCAILRWPFQHLLSHHLCGMPLPLLRAAMVRLCHTPRATLRNRCVAPLLAARRFNVCVAGGVRTVELLGCLPCVPRATLVLGAAPFALPIAAGSSLRAGRYLATAPSVSSFGWFFYGV